MLGWSFLVFVILVLWLYLPRLAWISVEDAREELKRGAILLDVRTARESIEQSVPGTTNIPVDELDSAIKENQLPKDRPILLFCASGMRSAAALRTLRVYGFTQLKNLGTFKRATQVVRGTNSVPG